MKYKPMIWMLTVLAAMLLLLVLFPALTGVMQYEYQEKPLQISTVVSKIPELEWTEAEIALADTILGLPVIRTALEDGWEGELKWDQVAASLGQVVPGWAEHTSVAIFGRVVILDFLGGTNRLILEYCDRDGGSADLVRKTWTNESGSTAPTIYTAEYVPILEQSWYKKHVSRRLFRFA